MFFFGRKSKIAAIGVFDQNINRFECCDLLELFNWYLSFAFHNENNNKNTPLYNILFFITRLLCLVDGV